MSVTFNPNEKTYKVGKFSGVELVVKEEKVDYKTKSTGHAKIHELGINNLQTINRNALVTLIYMVANINREAKTTWANLGKYFQDGYLCFAKHQSYMATDRKLKQSEISRHLKELREAGFIRKLGKEYMKRNGVTIPLVVYCLGEFDIHNGNKTEVHYYQLDSEILQNLIKEGKSLFSHGRKYPKTPL